MVVLGNLLSLLGCVLMVAVGFVKKKERILSVQCVQFVMQAAGNLALGAAAGVVANLVNLARNLVFTKTEGTVWLKVLFIAVQAALTLWTGDGTLIQWLPVLATVLFTWFVDTKNVITFKIVIIACQVMWTTYDWYYLNYVAVVFDVLTILSNVAGIVAVQKNKA